jgi:hypothetical protein
MFSILNLLPVTNKLKIKLIKKLTGKMTIKENINENFKENPSVILVGDIKFALLIKIKEKTIAAIKQKKKKTIVLFFISNFLCATKFAIADAKSQCAKTIPMVNSFPWKTGAISLSKKICNKMLIIPHNIK